MGFLEIAKNLMSIPSYFEDDGIHNEREISEFVNEFLKKNTHLDLQEQIVEGKRHNIIARDEGEPQLMFCCHLDTVGPKKGWTHKEFGADVDGDKLYGLGASDMKGGIACLLDALESIGDTKGLVVLFDVDEEYQFKGIRKFVSEYDLHPKLAVFPEPGLAIRNGHRGLVEIYFQTVGKTGHAARPSLGRNAIMGTYQAIEHLMNELDKWTHEDLGSTSCNVAFLRGGVNKGYDERGELAVSGKDSGNNIPDICEAVLDIRTATEEPMADTISRILNDFLVDRDYRMDCFSVRHNYGALFVPKTRLSVVEKIFQEVVGSVVYPDKLGYQEWGFGEAKILQQKFADIDCVYLGPGPTGTGHKPDEFVSISEMKKARDIFQRLIEEYCCHS